MKRPSCKNWNNDRCSLDLFGGTPSPGVCFGCDQYKGPPRGAGDLFEIATTVTGVKSIVKAATKATGKSCNCSARKAGMNRALPFKKGS